MGILRHREASKRQNWVLNPAMKLQVFALNIPHFLPEVGGMLREDSWEKINHPFKTFLAS